MEQNADYKNRTFPLSCLKDKTKTGQGGYHVNSNTDGAAGIPAYFGGFIHVTICWALHK